jgi:hypothetical protein
MIYSDKFIHEIYVGDIINVTDPGCFFINNAFVGCPSQTYCLIFRLKYDEIWIFSNIQIYGTSIISYYPQKHFSFKCFKFSVNVKVILSCKCLKEVKINAQSCTYPERTFVIPVHHKFSNFHVMIQFPIKRCYVGIIV